jgi:hypothetical protein
MITCPPRSAWCQRPVPRRGMTGPLGYDDLRAGALRQVAQLMAAAAITAPKSGGSWVWQASRVSWKP